MISLIDICFALFFTILMIFNEEQFLRLKKLLHGDEYLHITFGSKNTVINRFWSHPFDREFLRLFDGVNVFIYLTHQPKI